jgi:hypothetical protein
MAEFLLAILAILELWSQVGGQGHLDLMPWYTKFLLVTGMAVVTVAGTTAAVRHDRAWNAKTISCLILAAMIAGGMAAATYYAHLHENDDDNADEDGVTNSRVYLRPGISRILPL